MFADAGSLWGYKGQVNFRQRDLGDDGRSIHRHGHECMTVRSSVGAGVIWDSPFGPIRVDYAFPLTKDPNDRTQQLRFCGGTRF